MYTENDSCVSLKGLEELNSSIFWLLSLSTQRQLCETCQIRENLWEARETLDFLYTMQDFQVALVWFATIFKGLFHLRSIFIAVL